MTPTPFIFLWLHTIDHNSRIEYLVKESSTSDQLETNKKSPCILLYWPLH